MANLSIASKCTNEMKMILSPLEDEISVHQKNVH